MSVTIIDVARRAGVSFKTVSRVMNGEPSVRAATRDKVMAAAKALDYRINPQARALRSKRSTFIALLVDNPSRGYSQDVELGAMEQCVRDGFHLIVEDLRGQRQNLRRRLSRMDLAGIILPPPLCDESRVLKTLQDMDIAYVRMGSSAPVGQSPRVGIDDRRAAADMTRYLIAQGHRDIAFISGPESFAVSALRQEGYARAMSEAGLSVPEHYIQRGDFSYQSGLRCGETLIALPHRPSAIFASNDDMAAAVIAAGYKAGLSMPSALSIAGFDDAPTAQVVYPPLTTVRQPIQDMAAESVRQIVAGVRRAEAPIAPILLEHDIVPRGSVTAFTRAAQ